MTRLQDLITRGRELAAQERLDDADAVFTQVLEADAGNPEAIRFKGTRSLRTGALDDAESWFRRLIERDDGDAEAWYLLGMTLQQKERLEDAVAALERSLHINGTSIRAWLVRGGIFGFQGRSAEAAANYLRALRVAEHYRAIATDPEMRRVMAGAAEAVNAHLERTTADALEAVAGRHGVDAIARIRKATDGLLGKIRFETGHPLLRPGLFFVPDLEPREFFERDEFPWAGRVEGATDAIREELEPLLADEHAFAPVVAHAPRGAAAGSWDAVVGSGNWKAFSFYREGLKHEANCARCPRTTELVESVDLFRSAAAGPGVAISVLGPGTRIPARHGPTNGRVVAYLPLTIPGQGGVLKVGNEERTLEVGRLTLFDDSFRHEEWNDGDGARIVLAFDVWNPQLSEAEREAFTGTLAATRELELAAFDTPFSPGQVPRG